MTLALGVLIGMAGCSKFGDHDRQPGQAFLDSQIPAGLSPQYYPPEGFVWGGYRAGALPEARYGVASPPINPRAQVLILADADYPAEVYFELMRQWLDAGYGVWLLESPGQGGSGRYLLQNQSVFIKSYHDGQLVARDFIRDIIKPSPNKPLFVIGTGYSALTALSLSTLLKDDNLKGFIGYDPYLGGPIATGEPWHRDAIQPGYWGAIAQSWQMSNPDLRMRQKSDGWQKQMQKAYADLNGLHLPLTSLRNGAQVLIMEPKTGNTGQANTASALCARLPRCILQAGGDPETLGASANAFIQAQLPIIH
ncbi:serine aminopeptidase domain-containing protein [Asticcacaulis sp.]|uniref:serine aminopeptidase domain-containing protein n=1 Tax=Asticcacaulis sp. TaxID=1872648 RepID=UPI003F7BD46E